MVTTGWKKGQQLEEVIKEFIHSKFDSEQELREAMEYFEDTPLSDIIEWEIDEFNENHDPNRSDTI